MSPALETSFLKKKEGSKAYLKVRGGVQLKTRRTFNVKKEVLLTILIRVLSEADSSKNFGLPYQVSPTQIEDPGLLLSNGDFQWLLEEGKFSFV